MGTGSQYIADQHQCPPPILWRVECEWGYARPGDPDHVRPDCQLQWTAGFGPQADFAWPNAEWLLCLEQIDVERECERDRSGHSAELRRALGRTGSLGQRQEERCLHLGHLEPGLLPWRERLAEAVGQWLEDFGDRLHAERSARQYHDGIG